MKTIILVKQHRTIQLGHLYEHLFLARLKEFFYENRVYKSLDLAMWGTTYEQAGVIELVCELYSKKAQKLANDIKNVHIDFEEAVITAQLQAIAAEESQRLHVSNKQDVLDELQKLDKQEWSHIEAIDFIDSKAFRRRNNPIYLTDRLAPPARKLLVEIKLDRIFLATHREMAPIFNVIARWLLLTCSDQVTIRHGLFGGELYGDYSSLRVTSELLVAGYGGVRVDIQEICSDIEHVVSAMTTRSMVARYANEFQSISYGNAPSLAPDTERLLVQAGVYMGERGWKLHATKENIENLLRHMSLELTFGRQKISVPLVKHV